MPVARGAHWDGTRVLFTLESAHASGVDLCLFEHPENAAESRRLPMARDAGGLWQLNVEEAGPGSFYGYRVHGPFAPQRGHRFNPTKLLIDPYARAITGEPRLHSSLFGHRRGPHPAGYHGEDSAAFMPKCVVVDPSFDWQGDRPPKIPWCDTVIYECHVKGLTRRHPLVPEPLRGTYLGLVQPPVLEHLHNLGVTAVELLPVHQIASEPHLQERGFHNYWGYSTLGFFAPHGGYATATRGEQVKEFKIMVRELHRAGFEVILDVVFNHTAEGDHHGPTLSLRGIDNRNYYRLRHHAEQRYENTTGCGNSLDCSRPATQRLILDSLRYWVDEMHVDGFRFDLATTLGRTEDGEFSPSAPLFKAMAQDPVISRAKLIAEPWDLGPGGYRLGEFPAGWGEWNDRYRDTVRRFWRGDGDSANTLREMALRLTGSQDVLAPKSATSKISINYVVSHDGFTLADMVSYEHKRNEANGEHNRDGTNNNSSQNWGVEGPTEQPDILRARRRAQRNLFATLCFSTGVPMMHQGDELGFSQQGNNNPYCQDNETTWLRWSKDAIDHRFLSFACHVLALRRKYPEFCSDLAPTERDVLWFHPSGRNMTEEDWRSPEGRSLGMKKESSPPLLLLLNGGTEKVDFFLPEGPWQLLLDTANENQPSFKAHPGKSSQRLPRAASSTYCLKALSLVLMRKSNLGRQRVK